MATDYLWQRGHQYYLRLAVPRRFRHLFPTKDGKPRAMIAESLGSDYAAAKVKAVQRAGVYMDIFARLRKGEVMTTEQIAADLAVDMAAVEREMREMFRAADAQMNQLTAADDEWQKSNPYWRWMMQNAKARQTPKGETVAQAAEAWFADMMRDPSAAVKQATLDGHRLRVRAFVEHCGDIPLTDITRAMAADFLTKVAAGGRSNRTTNSYATTLSGVFQCATRRGQFTGHNPFDGQKRKAGGDSYEAFTVPELQALFDSFKFEVAPKHTPETALPWVSLIAAYTGMRLEEIAQLRTNDIRSEGANGSTVTVIDIHNGGSNTLKNESSARLVPVHSALVRAGLLRYRDSLPADGLLFPGLARRASKGGKIGARLGELFRKRLETLGLKRKGLCFHSFRHTVAGALEAAAVSQTDAARVLGHTVAGMSYGVYSSGPGLKRLAAVVEEIAYPGLTA
jgi:integrase